MTATIPTNFGATLFAAADSYDLDAYTNMLAPDVRFQFGNAAAITGRETVHQTVGAFFKSIKGINHTIIQEWIVDETIIQKLQVLYTRLDGGQVTLPAMNLLQVKDNLVTDYQIYVDLTPVYA